MHDPLEYGDAIVALALKKHKVDSDGAILLDDAQYGQMTQELNK
jgi:hypothetical protein